MKMEKQFWFLEHIENDDYPKLHYDFSKHKWVKREEYTGCWFPGRFPCQSYRAAKRHLRKHTEIPKGTRFRLCSRFIGFDRILTK